MSSVSKIFGTDASKEVDGVVVEYRAVGGSVRVRLARAGGDRNVAFAKALNEKSRPYARALANDQCPPEVVKAFMMAAIAETVVKEWDVTDDDGKPIPCTPENVVKEFEESPDFYRFIFDESQKLANYRIDYRDAAIKN